MTFILNLYCVIYTRNNKILFIVVEIQEYFTVSSMLSLNPIKYAENKCELSIDMHYLFIHLNRSQNVFTVA